MSKVQLHGLKELLLAQSLLFQHAQKLQAFARLFVQVEQLTDWRTLGRSVGVVVGVAGLVCCSCFAQGVELHLLRITYGAGGRLHAEGVQAGLSVSA